MKKKWKPVADEESFEIVRRRLFSAVTDRKAVNAVCREFAEFYRTYGDDFPQDTQQSRYEHLLKAAYPIHLEVFERLYQDWSSLDNFQRTRGELKLMANVIHRLWKDGNNDPLIMPGSLPLYDLDTRNNIIYYLPPGWDPVLNKDIDGESAQPTRLDTENTRFGNIQSCRRVARTLFLGSAPSVSLKDSTAYRGIDEKRILLGAALPAASLGVFKDALNRLKDKLYYLNVSAVDRLFPAGRSEADGGNRTPATGERGCHRAVGAHRSEKSAGKLVLEKRVQRCIRADGLAG